MRLWRPNVHVFGQHARIVGNLSGIGNKAEPPRHAPYLFRRIRRAKPRYSYGEDFPHAFDDSLPVVRQPLQEGAPGVPVVLARKFLETVGQAPASGRPCSSESIPASVGMPTKRTSCPARAFKPFSESFSAKPISPDDRNSSRHVWDLRRAESLPERVLPMPLAIR